MVQADEAACAKGLWQEGAWSVHGVERWPAWPGCGGPWPLCCEGK